MTRKRKTWKKGKSGWYGDRFRHRIPAKKGWRTRSKNEIINATAATFVPYYGYYIKGKTIYRASKRIYKYRKIR